MENQLAELRTLASRADNGRTGIPRVATVQGPVPQHELTAVFDPMVTLVLQGSTSLTIGSGTLVYDSETYFVLSLDLPAVGAVHPTPAGEPYLAVSLTIDPDIVGDMLSQEGGPVPSAGEGGFSVASVTPEFLDAWLRMLRLKGSPAEIAILAPAYEREILYRVLQGPHGSTLRDMAAPDTALSRIRLAIQWIRTHFADPLRVEMLAEIAAMSPSAFHRHFKAATAMSPLQFQKHVRLLQARTLLIAGGKSTSAVALAVGYESGSQFSREYSRFFGSPPAMDAAVVVRDLGCAA
jgi:AraC-like DNA-binding protein